jgi:hypothetical protein
MIVTLLNKYAFCICNTMLKQKPHLLSVFRTIKFGGIDHVGQGSLGLSPLTGLETTVWVDPELIRLEVTRTTLDMNVSIVLRLSYASISWIRSLISCSLGTLGEWMS